jgi:hypothetical protein
MDTEYLDLLIELIIGNASLNYSKDDLRINNDDTEWKQIQEQYETIKKNTLKNVKEKFNFNIN